MLVFVFDTQDECDKFIRLYELYGKTVYYTISRFVQDPYLIEDLSQDIYLKIAEHLDAVDLDDYIKSRNYIITIARNYCKNHLRNTSKILETPLDSADCLPDDQEEILDQMIQKEEVHRLTQMVHELDDIYKSVLELKFVNGFSNDEIASFLKLKKKTVEMRIYRANQILRKKMAEDTYEA
ncbi:MAG: sigma-70 family RNA polymerase sigma factor [Eubacteriales bacterium]|nr:sigma-70 family RNA polymerase sigma factor [Eubacteriales bacterium]